MSLLENPTLYNLSESSFTVGYAMMNFQSKELLNPNDYLSANI
jgi:hypothetical protein